MTGTTITVSFSCVLKEGVDLCMASERQGSSTELQRLDQVPPFQDEVLCCYTLEFKVEVSCSLPCAISHAAYLLQIPFFCSIQLFSALPIASAWLWILNGKREKSVCSFFPLGLDCTQLFWHFSYDYTSWTTEDIPSVSSGNHFNLSWKSDSYWNKWKQNMHMGKLLFQEARQLSICSFLIFISLLNMWPLWNRVHLSEM